MNVSVRWNGQEKELVTMINLKNCFDPRNNPTKIHQLPLIYVTPDKEDKAVGTVDKRGEAGKEYYVINIVPVVDDLYQRIWDNIYEMKLKVRSIEGDRNGYLFILEDN